MKTENVTLTYKRFYDKNNEPTCAYNFNDGSICEFFRTRRFGVDETCLFTDNNELLERRGKDGLGTTIPGKWCPLWSDV